MSFRKAVEASEALKPHYKAGLQALRKHSTCIEIRDRKRLKGSVFLEGALKKDHPDDPHWDYAIGIRVKTTDCVAWVEVHPTSPRDVEIVLAKFAWIRKWTSSHAKQLAALPGSYYWVATGAMTIRPGTAQRRRLAESSIKLVGRRLSLDRSNP